MIIDGELEEGPASSPGIRAISAGYKRRAATDYNDRAAGLTARQAIFYRNLIRLAEALGSSSIPVDFEKGGRQFYLDHGCIKIAELAGFIRPLANGPSGVVETITLAWRAERGP